MNTPAAQSTITIHNSFPRFKPDASAMPIWCITPNEGHCIHRFFDTPPFSPSGRYAAVFRMPSEEREPGIGDVGEVVLIDLAEGGEKVVATTRGWEAQMGCNLNWGEDDSTLVFNDVDVDTWTPQLVKLNPHTGERQQWPGGVYHVSPCGRYAACCSTEKMRRTQKGYGVLVPDEHSRRNVGLVDDDGLFITDLRTGERTLVLSLASARAVIPDFAGLSAEAIREWEVYGFHCKWSPDGRRLIFTIRRYRHEGQDRFNAFGWAGPNGGVRYEVLTLRPDGTDVHNAVPAEYWLKSGHHINFFPDGEKLSMNLGHFRNGGLDLVQVDYDGQNLRKITDAAPGSGHPSVHPDGRHILTDTYAHEKPWAQDGVTPLRWIDLKAGTEREIVRMKSAPEALPDSSMRIDPHPAWDRSWRWIAFNANVNGVRRVLVADMQALLEG